MPDSIRRFLVVLFTVGAVGTGFELVLLEHTEDAWQWAPLVLLGVSLVVLLSRLVSKQAWGMRVFQALMALMVVSAGIGWWLHFGANREFELEIYPGMTGFDLFWESLKGATPTLAPGMMLHLGLVGLAYTYKHPALRVERPNLEE